MLLCKNSGVHMYMHMCVYIFMCLRICVHAVHVPEHAHASLSISN